MTTTTEIRREIVNQERRVRRLVSQGEAPESEKASEIRAEISSLRSALLEMEKKVEDKQSGEEYEDIDDLLIEHFADHAKVYSEDMLFSRYAEKYSPEYYYPRNNLDKYLSDFISSDKSVMVLTGKAGTGKSAFVCNLAESPPKNTVVWLQDCAYNIRIKNFDIDKFIGQTLGVEFGVLKYANKYLSFAPQSTILLIFDSVNEYKERRDLLEKLAVFVNAIKDKRIKVLITCRMPIWDSIKRHFSIPLEKGFHISGPDTYVTVASFTDVETAGVFEQYRSVYNIKTTFSSLSTQVKYFITNPLFLNMAARVYENEEIPNVLALRDVFSEYIAKCLGENGYESEEYKVLNRVIELMYENTKRELEIAIIQRDDKIGRYLIPEYDTPFFRLVDEGLLSQRLDKSLLKKIEVIFVTYERVFEYLLAEIILGEVTIEKIIQNLELSQVKSFIQLRGATELALSFSILNSTTKVNIIIEIAKLNRPDSRQFLCDVIQTIYDSGNREKAERIIFEISEDQSFDSKYLAVQAAYQLKLDRRLLSLSLSSNSDLRDLATLFLYERWNYSRREGKLEEGYKLLHELKSKINLMHLQTSVFAIQALLTVNANMFVHIVDDPKAVYPMIDILKELISKLPGFNIEAKGSVKSSFQTQKTNFFIDLVAAFLSNKITDWDEAFPEIIENKKTIRAMLDVGELTSLESLIDYETEVVTILTWDNMFVRFIASSLIIHQTYYNIDEHLPFFLELIYGQKLKLVHKLWATRALVLSLVARMVMDKNIPDDIMNILSELVIVYWHEINDEVQNIPEFASDKKQENLFKMWQTTLFSMLIIEATLQRKEGIITGSKIISEFIENPTFCEPDTLEIFINVLEQISFQGFVDFAFKTLLEQEFRFHWEKKVFEHGVKKISNIRSFYQQEVDSILQNEKYAENIWRIVKSFKAAPNTQDIREISTEVWTMVAIAVNIPVEKAAGLYLLEIAISDSVKDAMRRIVRVTMEILSEPERVDIAHIQWGLAHDPNWNRFDKLWISPEVMNSRPDLHAHYKNLVAEIITKCGKGILYGDL